MIEQQELGSVAAVTSTAMTTRIGSVAQVYQDDPTGQPE